MTEEQLREQIELSRKNILRMQGEIANEENRIKGWAAELRKVAIPKEGEFRICTYSPASGGATSYVAQITSVREDHGIAIVNIVSAENPVGPVREGVMDWSVNFDEIGPVAEQVWRAKA